MSFVALGDSAGVGVGARTGGGYVARLHRRLRARGFEAGLHNLCVAGARAVDVVRRPLDEAVRIAERTASLVTLVVGGNDAWRGTSPRAFARNLEVAVGRLREAGAWLVLGNVPDLSFAPVAAQASRADDYANQLTALNATVARVAERFCVPLVDLFAYSHATLQGRPELFCEDGFHPSAEGYELWTDAMWPHVLSAARRVGAGAGMEARV